MRGHPGHAVNVASWISKTGVGIDAHGCVVPGDLEAHEAVQAAPGEEGAQGGRRVSLEAVLAGPGRELGGERRRFAPDALMPAMP